ncbi:MULTISPECIES: WYL domain-containing protein [Campylobacter]|uniref:WYL domain-containing protein n=1 Tax=Campylobacter TaxID=194 RepID=UPI001473A4E9|nr:MULTISPECIES: WYL domain-containing protein [unclassified Campylobacter]MBE3609451.1 WYL domain-containing protein [Campylobacter sp. RM12916]
MQNKKSFELLNLLKELVKTSEINVKNYALKTALSERTIRRYLSDIREYFGEDSIMITSRGNYIAVDKDLLSTVLLPSQKESDEFEKLIDLLHIINPGFTKVLPSAYKRIDDKLGKELADAFLIKGSPHEKPINIEILSQLKKAIKFRKYCDIYSEGRWLKEVKVLKIIYCKGNWQLAVINPQYPQNNGFSVIRLCFIDKVNIHSHTFNISTYTENFIRNLESFWDGYKCEPYLCEVAVSDEILKFFKVKKFFKTQNIAESLQNGWTKITFEITSDDMILMLARRWFPDFIIISPISARDKFSELAKRYLLNLNVKF